MLNALALVLLLHFPVGNTKTLDRYVNNANAFGLASIDETSEWSFIGCNSGFPQNENFQNAPLGRAMDAEVCQSLCDSDDSPTPAPYAIVYDTEFCVCTYASGTDLLQSSDYFAPCAGLLTGSTEQQCGAPGQSVYFARADNAQVSHMDGTDAGAGLICQGT